MIFEYELDGIGWAKARVASESGSADLSASYLSDALRNLLVAVAELLEGSATTECSWDEEPGRFRWLFQADNDVVNVQVFGNVSSYELELIFETTEPLQAVARTIAATAQGVLDRYGEAGYFARWYEFPFPIAELTEIKKLLNR